MRLLVRASVISDSDARSGFPLDRTGYSVTLYGPLREGVEKWTISIRFYPV